MAKTFIIKLTDEEEFYFELENENDEIILRSFESYSSKQYCLTEIEWVREFAVIDSHYTKHNAGSGRPTFRLRALNNRVIALGVSYNSIMARDLGIEEVKQLAPIASVVEA
jgi:uncharacterized protein YegP (UPF0339 family)